MLRLEQFDIIFLWHNYSKYEKLVPDKEAFNKFSEFLDKTSFCLSFLSLRDADSDTGSSFRDRPGVGKSRGVKLGCFTATPVTPSETKQKTYKNQRKLGFTLKKKNYQTTILLS